MKDAVRRKSPRIPRRNDEDSKTSGRPRSETRESSVTGRKRRSSLSEDAAAKKRALSPANVPTFQKVGKTYIQGRLVDSYCWLCHKVTNEIVCERCPRRYHEACLAKAKLSINYCECQNVSVDGRRPMPWNPTELKQLLEYAIQEAIKEDKKSNQKSNRVENEKFQKYFKNWPIMTENDCLHTIIDITVLIDKMNNNPLYPSTGSFYADVKWIYHNCYIVYGANHEITKTALTLQKNFKLELTDIEACRECYMNKHKQVTLNANYFIRLCTKPHPIVWAKMRRYPFWPAKCLKIQNGHVDIRFFGTHEKANILLNQVFKYSKEHPENRGHSQQKFKEAVLETEYYIANYENLYGTFQYFKKKTPLDVITTKKHHRKGRGRASYETPRKRRSDDSILGGTDKRYKGEDDSILGGAEGYKSEGSSKIETGNTVDDVCQEGHWNYASIKKKSPEPLTTPAPADKDPTDVKVVLHPISVSITSFSERENEDESNLRSNENFLVANSNSDYLMSNEKEKNASNGHVADDHLEALPSTSSSLGNPSNMNNFSDVNSAVLSENSNQLIKGNVDSCSNPSSLDTSIPIITSTTGGEDSHGLMKDFRSPTCDTLANFLNSRIFSRNPLFKGKSVPETSNFCENKGDDQQEHNSDEEDDDDDCLILPESQTLASNSISAIAKNAAIYNSVFELFMSNKPRLRHLHKKLQNFVQVLFAAVSLEAQASNPIEDIREIYTQYLNKINSLESEKEKLIEENRQLTAECEQLKEKVADVDRQGYKKDLVREMIANSTHKQIETLKQEVINLTESVSERDLLVAEYESEVTNKNKEIEQLKEKLTPVLKCDRDCQVDLFLDVSDTTEHAESQIMDDLKELSDQQDFSQIEDFNEICSTQQQEITETIEIHTFPHSNLLFQSHNETTSATNQMFMEQVEQIAGNSSNGLCETRNLVMSDSTTYVTQSVIAAPMPSLIALPTQIPTALPTQVNTYSNAEDAQSSLSKRKQRIRKPTGSTSVKINKGNKKNG